MKNLNPRPKFSDSVLKQLREWGRASDKDPEIRAYNFKTQLKIASIYLLFAACLAADLSTDGFWLVRATAVGLLGLVAIPFLRVFMHSQGHWHVGNGPVRNFLLDHLLSLLFSVQQTGYRLGHSAHHLYDNDFDPRGFPKDLQSTYVFSRDGKPANLLLWGAFYVSVYQFAIHLFHALNSSRRSDRVAYLGETVAIVAFHAGVWSLAPGFYWAVYLPALAISWIVAAVALYAMHDVTLEDHTFYHAINCVEPFFNWFGDNDGYHIEHSLFPNIHPAHLKKANALIQPPKAQETHDNYFVFGLKQAFKKAWPARRTPSTPSTAAAAVQA